MGIKKLTADHLNKILELDTQYQPEYVEIKKDELEFIFNNPKTCCALGIFDKDKLVAWGTFIHGHHDRNKLQGIYEIYALFVDKKYRGDGLGEKLLKELIEEIKKTQNYKEVYLTTSPLNIPALFLYMKNGFVITDFKKDYYGPNTDRVFLTYKNK